MGGDTAAVRGEVSFLLSVLPTRHVSPEKQRLSLAKNLTHKVFVLGGGESLMVRERVRWHLI